MGDILIIGYRVQGTGCSGRMHDAGCRMHEEKSEIRSIKQIQISKSKTN
jgi:hypothetical protein